MCFDFLHNFCLKYFLFSEELSNISKIYIGLHVEYPFFLSDFEETQIFSADCQKNKKSKASLLYQPLRSNSKRQHNS